jgi:flagellum-specific peptidoglycan hydrolase FlgJ
MKKLLFLLLPLSIHSQSQNEIYKYLNQIGIKNAEIVMAQCLVETGHLTSNIFKENNNLFGMKEAKQRRTTALGTKNGHAYYKHWHDSVIDYWYYQRAYYNGVEDYYIFLSRMGYAANQGYIDKVKMVLWKWSSC